jgi:hypothetical protein
MSKGFPAKFPNIYNSTRDVAIAPFVTGCKAGVHCTKGDRNVYRGQLISCTRDRMKKTRVVERDGPFYTEVWHIECESVVKGYSPEAFASSLPTISPMPTSEVKAIVDSPSPRLLPDIFDPSLPEKPSVEPTVDMASISSMIKELVTNALRESGVTTKVTPTEVKTTPKPKPRFKGLSMSNPWELAAALTQGGNHIVAYGPPSIGKTYLAFSTGRGYYVLNCHEQMQVADIVGHWIPSNTGSWEYLYGPAVKAMKEGKRLILNELGRCNAEVLDMLLGILDSLESAKITLVTGETITPAEGFVCIATSNTAPEESLDPALQARLIPIKLDKPNPGIIARINAAFPALATMVENSYTPGNVPIDSRKALWFCDNHEVYGLMVSAQLAFGVSKGKDVANMLKVPTSTAANA